MMEKLAQVGGGGGARPSPFTISTITYKVVVYAPAERVDTLPLFLLYPYVCSVRAAVMTYSIVIANRHQSVLKEICVTVECRYMPNIANIKKGNLKKTTLLCCRLKWSYHPNPLPAGGGGGQ
jgi:hypothetical protein